MSVLWRVAVILALMAASAWVGRRTASASAPGMVPPPAPRAQEGPGEGHAPRRLASRGTPAPAPRRLPDDTLARAEPAEDWRNQRRSAQAAFAAMLGRGDGETVEAYRARLGPLVRAFLAGPRARVEGWRTEAERAANLAPEQRARLDAICADARAEALALTNTSVASGELTPYERNATGLLAYAGGLGVILAEAQGRLAETLSPAQLRAITDSGFDWAEYLALTTPWEDLEAPPPPPGDTP